ncbi:MAG: 2-hydroxyacid dehydrogenase [Candidatus Promineifilaceae bacterium]
MSKPFVIVSHELPSAWIASLYDECDVLIGPPTSVSAELTPNLLSQLPNADALLTMLTVSVDDALLQRASNLKVLSQMAVGVNNIDLQACTAKGLPVGHTPGVLTAATADMAMTLLLAAARRLPEASADASAGRWGTWSPIGWIGADLENATLGIVGMGRIGLATAQRAKAFGMNIVYHSRSDHPEAESAVDAKRVSLSELLRCSDFVSLHTPLSAETKHLINAETLAQMKPSAILVNTARGGVVDQNALEAALRNGVIRAAALDVTDPEPLPPSHPLFSLPNCLIAPHIGSATERTRRRMAERACANLLAGLRGEKLPFCANPSVYD